MSLTIVIDGADTTHHSAEQDILVCVYSSMILARLSSNWNTPNTWKCPCPGASILGHKRKLAQKLHYTGTTEDCLMLETTIVQKKSDVQEYPCILKPHADSCGNGILLAFESDELPEFQKTMVHTKLITDCLLYNGTHKADLRMFCIMHPAQKRVLLYKNALVRCAQTPVHNNDYMSLITNISVQQHVHKGGTYAPPMISAFNEYVKDSAHREIVYDNLVLALAATAKSVFSGIRARKHGFVMLGFDVLLRNDPYAAPIIIEYNIGWSRSETFDVARLIKRDAVQKLVKTMVSKQVQPNVSVAYW